MTIKNSAGGFPTHFSACENIPGSIAFLSVEAVYPGFARPAVYRKSSAPRRGVRAFPGLLPITGWLPFALKMDFIHFQTFPICTLREAYGRPHNAAKKPHNDRGVEAYTARLAVDK